MSKLTEKHHYKGTLICVEGIDGSGKSTQLALLRDWLKSIGQDVIFTEWNSSELISQTTKLAKKIQNILWKEFVQTVLQNFMKQVWI